MRYLLLLAALAACSSDAPPDPTEVIECDESWGIPPGSGYTCERRCAAMVKETGPMCETVGTGSPCIMTRVDELGERGCCQSVTEPDNTRVSRWYACE